MRKFLEHREMCQGLHPSDLMHSSYSCAETLTSNESTVLVANRITGVGTAPDQTETAQKREQQQKSNVQQSHLCTRIRPILEREREEFYRFWPA